VTQGKQRDERRETNTQAHNRRFAPPIRACAKA